MDQDESDFQKRNSMWGEYSDATLDRGDPSDPSYWDPDRVANRDRWRKGANLLNDNVERAITQDASDNGTDSDTALAKLGFRDQKDHGKYITGLFGNNGLFATQGAAVDPNLNYDWATGRASWKPGTDNYGQSRAINSTERQEYGKAQEYRNAGLKGFGQQKQASNFQRIAPGQFGKDAKGNWYNQGSNGDWEIRDNYGRRVGNASGSQYDPSTGVITGSNPSFNQAGGTNTPGMFPGSPTPGAVGGAYNPQGQQPRSLFTRYGNSAAQDKRPNAFRSQGNFTSGNAWTDDPLDPAYKQSGISYDGKGGSTFWGVGLGDDREKKPGMFV